MFFLLKKNKFQNEISEPEKRFADFNKFLTKYNTIKWQKISLLAQTPAKNSKVA